MTVPLWKLPFGISALVALLLGGCEALDGLGGPTAGKFDKKAVEHVAEAAQNSGEFGAAAGV
jgi:hypothetical protein